MKKDKNGFTLIELLIVIAIIGILASVVLTSLNTARAKGADATVKEDLHGIRAEAEIVNGDSGSYATICEDSNIAKALDNASTTSGVATTCNESPDSWAASATLKGANAFWCVDNTGAALQEATDIGSATTCP